MKCAVKCRLLMSQWKWGEKKTKLVDREMWTIASPFHVYDEAECNMNGWKRLRRFLMSISVVEFNIFNGNLLPSRQKMEKRHDNYWIVFKRSTERVQKDLVSSGHSIMRNENRWNFFDSFISKWHWDFLCHFTSHQIYESLSKGGTFFQKIFPVADGNVEKLQ